MAKAVKKKPTEEKKIGRPTKYDERRASIIIAWLKDGSTRKAAYGAAGIDDNTFYRWLEEFGEFRDAVTCAEAECEALMAKTIKDAARGDWRAAESWLKRRRKEDWSEKTEVDATSSDGSMTPQAVMFIPYVNNRNNSNDS